MPHSKLPRAHGSCRRSSEGLACLAVAFAGCASPSPGGSAHDALVKASAPESPVQRQSSRSTAERDEESALLRPDQIFKILEESPIHYRLVSDGPVEAAELSAILPSALPPYRPVDPFVSIVREGPEGRAQIFSARPPDEIAEVFERAGAAFEAEDYELARALWAAAAEKTPGYFKTYTFLGNSLHHLGDYVRAEQAFLRALELNPIDYQALLFLGDTYHQLGDFRRAKAVLSRAFMLNRGNAVVVERLKASLAKLSMQIRGDRLAPQVRIDELGPQRVALRLDLEGGLRWLPLAACLACWAHEERCSARAPESEDPLRIGMYRECLINQAASIAVRREKAERIGRDEAALLAAVEEGYLEAMIFWEVLAPVAPAIVFIVPEALQEDILGYIEKYVFVSTMEI